MVSRLRQSPADELLQESLMAMPASFPGPLLLGCAVFGLFFGVGAYAVVNSFFGGGAQRWLRSHERPCVRATEKP